MRIAINGEMFELKRCENQVETPAIARMRSKDGNVVLLGENGMSVFSHVGEITMFGGSNEINK